MGETTFLECSNNKQSRGSVYKDYFQGADRETEEGNHKLLDTQHTAFIKVINIHGVIHTLKLDGLQWEIK